MANLPTRNNNPGDLKDPKTGGFLAFNDPAEGFNALKNDIRAKQTGNTRTGLGPNSTLQQFASVYAPASDGNDPVQYATKLSQKLGVAPTAPLASVNTDKLALAIAGNEGYQGPQPTSDSSGTSGKMTTQQFAEKIKQKYPQYASMDDATLAQKIIAKYPQYQSQVEDSGGNSTSGNITASALESNQNASGVPVTPLTIPTGMDTNAPQQNQGFLSDLGQGNYGGAAMDAVKGVGNFLFPTVGDVYHDLKGDNTKTGLQQLGDLGSTALGAATLIPGVGEGALAAKGLLTGAKVAEGVAEGAKAAEGAGAVAKAAPGLMGSIGKNAVLGAGFGTTQALGAGATDPTKIAEGAATGAVGGGLIGGAGGLISKAAEALPARLVQGILKTSPDVAGYAIKKGLGSPAKMLTDSNSSIETLGTQLGQKLEDSGVANIKVTLADLLPDIQKAEPDAEITADSLKESLLKVAPLKKALITKLTEGEGLTLKELNKLKSEIGGNVYKTVFDDPTVKAGKQIGNAFYQAVKSKIVNASPETEGLFDQLSKEYSLNGALDKAVKRGAKSQALTLKDIMALLGGFSALGPMGAAAAYGLEKAATSPTVNLKAAGLLSKAVGASKLAPAATAVGSGLLGRAVGSQSQAAP